MSRKVFMVLGVALLALALVTPALAQEKFPDRPIDFICTWGVGGGADQLARTLSRLSEPILGVPLPVSNKSGAAGNTGISDVLAGKADGYTVAVYIASTLNTVALGTARHKLDDIDWIVRGMVAPSFLFVKYDSQFKTIQDLLKYAKENPNKLKVGTEGFGSVDEVTLRDFASKGYKMNIIPGPNPGERYAAILGGHHDVMYEQAGDVRQYLEAKQMRPLVIFAERRHPSFPDIPCSKELGFTVYLPQFRCVVGKQGIPADRKKILADAFLKAMATPEWTKFLKDQYCFDDSVMGPEKLQAWVKSEYGNLHELMKVHGMIK